MHPKFPEEVAYLGGLLRKSKLVAKGDDYEIHIEHEREFLENVHFVLKHKLDGKYRLEDGTLVIAGADMFDLLVTHFGHPNEDRRWVLTNEVRNSNPSHKAAFLRGVFDAFGSVGDTIVLKYAWHQQDLSEIKELLNDLNIECTIKKNELRVKDVSAFMTRVGTLRPVHHRRMTALLAG